MKLKLIFLILFVIGFSLEVYSQVYTQRIILQQSKPYYFAGDIMHLNFYLVGNDPKQNQEPELVYVNLLDKMDKSIFEGSILTSNGQGGASIKLSNSMTAGYYELVVYTNRMKNFGQQLFLRKRIAVFNGSQLSSENKNSIILKAVAEGGQLVDGITNRVIIHATDIYGNGVANKVTLLADGKVITTFQCDSYGFGTFYFTPDQSKKYDLVTEKGAIITNVMPVIEAFGTILKVRNVKETTQLILQTNKKEELKYKVEIRSQNEILYAAEHVINKRKPLLLTLKSKELQSKMLDAVVLDDKGEIINHRAFSTFISNDTIDSKLAVINEEIRPGEKVEFEVTTNAKLLALSVLDTTYSNKLESDPFAEFYFDYDLLDKCVLASIPVSSILNTTTFENLLFFKKPYPVPVSYKYEQEKYLYLKGRLTDSKPLPDTTKLLFYISGINVAYQATTDSIGLFSFPLLFDFHGKEKVIFVPLNKEHKFEKPQIQQYISITHKLDLSLPLKMDSVIVNQIIEQKNLSEIIKAYNYSNEVVDQEDRSFQIENIFDVYERSINMNEYVSFNSMEEVIKEILPGVQLRGKGQKKTLRIYSSELEKNFEDSPLIFINNDPVLNIQELLNIDPNDIESIKVVTSLGELNKIGSFAQNGVIIIKTKKNVKNRYIEDSTFEASGLLSSFPLEQPEPDFRDVLYSNLLRQENHQTKKIEILSSYRPGTYVIKLKAIGGQDSKVITQKISIAK